MKDYKFFAGFAHPDEIPEFPRIGWLVRILIVLVALVLVGDIMGDMP